MFVFIEFVKQAEERRDKMTGLLSILSFFFRDEFYEFNNTGA